MIISYIYGAISQALVGSTGAQHGQILQSLIVSMADIHQLIRNLRVSTDDVKEKIVSGSQASR